MKKIILILTIMISVMLLGACSSSDSTDLEERVIELEEQMSEVEQILIDIQIIEGLNGEREYYLPDNYTIKDTVWQGVNASTIETLGTELDKNNAPSYVLDENEEYIPFANVAQLLVNKYYGDVELLVATIGVQTDIVISSGDMTQDEFIAKTILLVEELSNYDFYIISSTQLVIQTQFNSTARIFIPIATLRSTFITMTPELIINGTYEIRKTGLSYDSVLVKDLYNQYVLSEEYINYVLDFK